MKCLHLAWFRVSGGQRRVLYELVVDHLSGMGDLGWEKAWRDEATLTMGLTDLAPVLHRLQRDAEGGLAESAEDRENRETDEAAHQRYLYAAETCKGLLLLLDHQETGQ